MSSTFIEYLRMTLYMFIVYLGLTNERKQIRQPACSAARSQKRRQNASILKADTNRYVDG